jgi:hypothetical protein
LTTEYDPRHKQWTVARVCVVALLTLLAVGMLLSGTACSRGPRVSYVPDGAATTAAKVEKLAQNVDLSAAAGIDIEHAPDVRLDVLVWLREQGAVGKRAATLLTTGFPDRTAAVPVLVEVANVDGVRSLVVVEAFGGRAGALTYRRLWIFNYETGDMLRSAAYR